MLKKNYIVHGVIRRSSSFNTGRIDHLYQDPHEKNKKLIIHNAEFDLSHLNNELSLIGKEKINKKNVIDTLELARDKFPGSQISLDALCKRFRIDNSKRIKHTALVDCELLSKVYINLIDQKEPTLNFYYEDNDNKQTVSNTHLTLQTNREV